MPGANVAGHRPPPLTQFSLPRGRSLPKKPSVGDRVSVAVVPVLLSLAAVAFVTFLYALIIAPYQQRNALRRQVTELRSAGEAKAPPFYYRAGGPVHRDVHRRTGLPRSVISSLPGPPGRVGAAGDVRGRAPPDPPRRDGVPNLSA